MPHSALSLARFVNYKRRRVPGLVVHPRLPQVASSLSLFLLSWAHARS
jgi:hypothetical protein